MVIIQIKFKNNHVIRNMVTEYRIPNVFEFAWMLQHSENVEHFVVRDESGHPYVESDFGFSKMNKWLIRMPIPG